MLPAVEKVPISKLVTDVEGVLGAIRRHDLNPGRFNEYLKILKRSEKLLQGLPKARPWLGSLEDDLLFSEATGQCRQLVDSFPVWRCHEANIVVPKLRRICSGSTLPPDPEEKTRGDHARNYLAEFATAGLFSRHGFRCVLTANEEDVIATHPSVGRVVIEAKRPFGSAGLAQCAEQVKKQLGDRAKGDKGIGLAVFAIDRVSQFHHGDLVAADVPALNKALDVRMGYYVNELRKPEYALFPEAVLGATLLNGAVFCKKEGIIVAVSVLGFFCTGDDDDPRSRQVFDTMEGMMYRVVQR